MYLHFPGTLPVLESLRGPEKYRYAPNPFNGSPVGQISPTENRAYTILLIRLTEEPSESDSLVLSTNRHISPLLHQRPVETASSSS